MDREKCGEWRGKQRGALDGWRARQAARCSRWLASSAKVRVCVDFLVEEFAQWSVPGAAERTAATRLQ
jgi:hypothetical protein